ncbi:MAG: 6-carboxytetrahydropterin synthase QueD [Nitrosomonadales bacterium]|jgi:6-pyruvoyltetrahydropterin/6-carboxytetrahydropterin synthase|nr:6-carboxytetrahydropterin synthase QueD [Nitrosomonadales bacterium]MBT3917785.1 6-carboxytetrahydropterin synthase QueD [Nitrosomonadales bacterium]MBT4183610.1 6-carboxytetrahydropterin synthase QueD [Nitrosomonadales bacterium]MBT4571308.1 6-carboxytetrahydropterin synthase QueD [Nitrosomonadales bacterium]MBT4759497.1 6-carboxytetrahydropterin synthase QueD [Nitrosomonadales bacterium]
MEITTRMEFDAGHRIPNHKSVCKNLHGHRYAIEVTVKGSIKEQSHESDFGMVMDFKDAKNLIKEVIVNQWDHAFIVYKKDFKVIDFLNSLDNHKTVIFTKVPTAENMALIALESLSNAFKNEFGDLIRPIKVRLYETPNNWADALAS